MKNRFLVLVLFAFSSLLLSSCSGRKNVFEVQKNTLDPTVAVKRNNLVLPPNYTLTTPKASQKRAVSGSYDSLYTFLLDPSSVNLKRVHNQKSVKQPIGNLSKSDKEILKLVEENSGEVIEDIRDIVNKDAYNQVRKSKSFVRKIFLLNPELEKDNALDNKFDRYIKTNKEKAVSSK